ncbi:GTPase Der [Frankliniella fusca]|uniref:GTPase Der n=1 Tax=Frankliniella fusca TaxID=407009 RepID=A0AAE1HTC2_9NEOP|nr:GTPase Der [Frankliniella fusca]
MLLEINGVFTVPCRMDGMVSLVLIWLDNFSKSLHICFKSSAFFATLKLRFIFLVSHKEALHFSYARFLSFHVRCETCGPLLSGSHFSKTIYNRKILKCFHTFRYTTFYSVHLEYHHKRCNTIHTLYSGGAVCNITQSERRKSFT